MKNKAIYIFLSGMIFLMSLALLGCNKNPGQTQAEMFNNNRYTKKKKSKHGTYSNPKKIAKKPPSVEYAEGYIADDNPKKTAKKINKQMEKNKRKADKKRAKHNKKVHQKIKTTKKKSTEE